MRFSITLCATLAAAAPARADDMAGMAMGGAAAPPPLHVEVGALAGRYDDPFFASGDYQAATLALAWQRGRLAAHGALAFYHLTENGAAFTGVGDLALGVDATVWSSSRASVMAMAMVSLPTGKTDLLGMGHAMAMSAVSAMLGDARATLTITAGYDRALASLVGHDHGPLPLVEPMNMSELAGEVRGDLLLGALPVTASGRFAGALPVGMPAGYASARRVIAGLGARWARDRLDAGAELQVGLAGDPFSVRGVIGAGYAF